MNYAAWYNGAYGDCAFSVRGEPDDEERTVECASCGADLPASWDRDSEEYVAGEACECEDEDEDEDEEIDDATPLSPITMQYPERAEDAFIAPESPIQRLCHDIARSYKHTLGGVVPPRAD